EQPPPGLAAPHRRADPDVRGSPDNRNDRQGGERCGGQSRREFPASSATACGCDERNGADPEGEGRQTDEGGQQAPDDEEDADEVDMGSHRRTSGVLVLTFINTVAFGRRCIPLPTPTRGAALGA